MLHTASLLWVDALQHIVITADDDSRVDDVEDSSTLRRGIPVAHSIFGVAQTINTANYVYFQALQELGKLNNPMVLQVYTGALALSGFRRLCRLWWNRGTAALTPRSRTRSLLARLFNLSHRRRIS